MNTLDSVLHTLSEAPENEIEPSIAKRIGALQGGNAEIISVELRGILLECIEGDLASDFALWAIEQACIAAETRKT